MHYSYWINNTIINLVLCVLFLCLSLYVLSVYITVTVFAGTQLFLVAAGAGGGGDIETDEAFYR
jgi:hypothetical protein